MRFIEIYHSFIFQARKGNLTEMISQYFTSKTVVEITRSNSRKKEHKTLVPFCKYLERVTVLQYKLENIKAEKETLNFQIFMVTRDQRGSIDLTEHKITSFWKNNKIIKHIHTIISY